MGAAPELDRRPLHFGVFELNPSAGELRKHGVRVRLQDQPLKVLLCLIENSGEICTREELIRRIWPEGTFVDYDRGLNVAVTRLRQVLGDSADAPRYVETLGRKGYRFIAPVERITPPAAPIEEPSLIDVPPSADQTTPRQVRRWWPYAAILGLGLIASAGWWRVVARPRPAAKPLVRLSLDLGPDLAAAGLGTGSLLALSPDGSRLAVSVGGADGKVRLATRRLDQSQLTVLPGTEGGASPFFSPDGQWIAFFANGKLQKMPADGGTPVTLCEADTHAAGRASMYYPAGSWGDDGNIITALNVAVGLWRVPSTGGTPELLKFKQEPGEIYRWPQVLPGSGAILFTAARGDYENGTIDVFSFKTGERKTVQRGGIVGRYLPTGHLVYLHQNALLAVGFDLETLKAHGTPQPVLEDMGGRLAGWNYGFAQNGSFVYENQPNDPQLSIFWLDRAGKLSPLQSAPASYSTPRFSPDGKRLAFSMSGRSSQGIWVQDIWVQDLDSGRASRLTSLSGVNDSPVWTADGQNLIFRSVDQPNPGIYIVRADGGGEVRHLADLTAGVFPSSMSHDGKRLAIWDFAGGGLVWTTPVESGPEGPRLGNADLFYRPSFNPPISTRTSPAFSPDGRWIAYCALESGQIEVYVRPFPGPGPKWRVSKAGGRHPVWSRNGHEIFFLTRNGGSLLGRVMVANYQVTGDTFVPGEPSVWSDKLLLDLGELYAYDVAPDGKRLAVVMHADGEAEEKPVHSLAFLVNFFDELRRRVPVERN
ncbi:MAG TPA: winged helix-turn-helix domain-containing protein [Bryobacteraceae bacterium]|nr:winged helix-turn-helix domain-containing protein [Bryobacteraceae bacterium]